MLSHTKNDEWRDRTLRDLARFGYETYGLPLAKKLGLNMKVEFVNKKSNTV